MPNSSQGPIKETNQGNRNKKHEAGEDSKFERKAKGDRVQPDEKRPHG